MKALKVSAFILLGVVLVLCGITVLVYATGSEDTPSRTQVIDNPTQPNNSKPRTSKTKEVPTIQGDDVVHVGYDVPAGIYRTNDRVEDGIYCYWSKSTDSEGRNIISNDLPQGGRPQVTLKKGQWFTSKGCPDWIKQ